MVPPMAQRSTDGAPTVQVRSPAADSPSWARIGVIAALGFIAGVAWPRLAGVRLGPSLPDGALSPTVAMSASANASAPSPVAEASSVGVPPAVENPAPLATASASQASSQAAADGKPTQVEWEVALVRDAPKTGKVVARLPRGSRLLVGPVKDGWYPVTYGSGNSSQGWVYRGAIGR
jgi:hypothetical protein